MAEVTVHVSITDFEPFKRFIGQVTEAHAEFYSMTSDQAKALPDNVFRGIVAIQGAVADLAATSPSPIQSVDTQS